MTDREKAIKRLEEQGYKVTEPSEEARKSLDEVDYMKVLKELLVTGYEDFCKSPLQLWEPKVLIIHPETYKWFSRQCDRDQIRVINPKFPGLPLRKQIVLSSYSLDIYESLDVQMGKMIIK